jgi:hypothetical protein
MALAGHVSHAMMERYLHIRTEVAVKYIVRFAASDFPSDELTKMNSFGIG